MITSKDNDKLKLIRKLHERKHREHEGLFIAEGEDLVAAADAAGWEPAIGVYPRIVGEGAGGLGVYLDGIGDPGNVGTIIRTADALLGAPVICGNGTADPFSPKAVRASMGSIFSRPPLAGGLSDLADPVVGLAAHGGEAPDDASVGALVVGAERHGLSEEAAARCDRLWTIPLRPGVESLNVAAAAAIAIGRISSAADD